MLDGSAMFCTLASRGMTFPLASDQVDDICRLKERSYQKRDGTV